MRHAAVRSLSLALIGIAPALFAASPERKEAQAQILEQESYPCVNCFFGPSDYFFCMSADSQIFLAYASIPTFNWTDPQKNYFGKVHKAWKNPTPTGDSIKIEYDEKHIWIPRADGKLVRLKRDDSHDVFTNPQCRGAVKKPARS